MVPGDIVGFPETGGDDHFIDFECPECQSDKFRMIGMCIDGDISDIIKLQCYDCETTVEGYFVWLDQLEEE